MCCLPVNSCPYHSIIVRFASSATRGFLCFFSLFSLHGERKPLGPGYNIFQVPNYVYLLFDLLKKKMENCMLVDGSFIACISILVLKTKTIHIDEEQIRISPASSLHGRWSASRQTSDHKELPRRKILLSRTIGHNFPLRTFSFIDKSDRFHWLRRKHWWSRNEHIICHERTNNIHS